MTIEQKAKAYDDVIRKAKITLGCCNSASIATKNTIYDIFPELNPEIEESEDERIRKELIEFLKLPHPQFVGKRDHEKWIAWLERQGKNVQPDIPEDGQILNSLTDVDKRVFLDRPVTLRAAINWLERQCETKTDCPQNHQDVNHPNGCIVFADFNGGEGFYKLHLDYLNQKQVEEIERMIRIWNIKNNSENKGEKISDKYEKIHSICFNIGNPIDICIM